MSKALDMADAMALHLETLPELAGIDVIVDRQKDIDNEILKGVEKAQGLAVVILYVGGKNITQKNPGAILKETSYAVAVHAVPVIRAEGQSPSDEICEAIQRALHGWAPAGSANAQLCATTMQYVGDELVPDPDFLIYDNQFKIALRVK